MLRSLARLAGMYIWRNNPTFLKLMLQLDDKIKLLASY